MKRLLSPLFRFFTPSCMIREDRKLADDFTPGMYGLFWSVAWPALMESVLIGIISFADTLMVSTEGKAAIAAVGLTGQPRLLFFVVILAISIGVNAVTARRRGQGNRDGANRVLTEVLPIVVLLSVLFFAVSFFFAKPLLTFAGAKEDTIGDAVVYFRIIMFGMIFTSVSLTVNAAQRGCGKTKISMSTNLAANLVNLTFNALLINGLLFFPHLGVKGAAIATVLGNFTAMVISLCSVRKKNGYLFLSFRQLLRFKRDALPPVIHVASGSILEQVFLRIGFFAFAKMVAELGTDSFAAHQIVMNMINLSFTAGDGLSIAASTLIGQNLGSKRPDKALVYGKIAQRIGVLFGVVLLTLFLTLRIPLVKLFSRDPFIVHTGSILMIFAAFITLAQIAQVMFSGCLRGAGDTRYMAVVSMVSVMLVRGILTFLFCYPLGFGVYGAWIALIVDQYIRFLLSGLRFYSQKWAKVIL